MKREPRKEYKAKLTVEQRREVLRQYIVGEKVDAIAAQFGVGREYPGRLARRRGIPVRRHQERYPHLTPLQREQIVSLYEVGEDIDLIASLFRVGKMYPSRLFHEWGGRKRRRRYTWRNADGADGRAHGASTADARTP